MINQIHGHPLPESIPVSEASRIRELEEQEISKLASLCEGPNDQGWRDIECSDCLDSTCIQGSPRELAEKVWAIGWMCYHGKPLCFDCQNR